MARIAPGFGDMADGFDALFQDVERLAELEADALEPWLRKAQARTVLDCACGTGIQAIPLARRGFIVSASDISRRMVAELRRKAAEAGLAVDARVADFRTLGPWRGQVFDAVICTGNSLTLAPSAADVARALAAMAACAAPGGPVIVGLHDYTVLLEQGASFHFRRADPVHHPAEVRFDVRRFGAERTEVDYFRLRRSGGRWRLQVRTKSYLMLGADRLAQAMRDAGLLHVQLFDVSGQRPSSGDEWTLAIGYGRS